MAKRCQTTPLRTEAAAHIGIALRTQPEISRDLWMKDGGCNGHSSRHPPHSTQLGTHADVRNPRLDVRLAHAAETQSAVKTQHRQLR